MKHLAIQAKWFFQLYYDADGVHPANVIKIIISSIMKKINKNWKPRTYFIDLFYSCIVIAQYVIAQYIIRRYPRREDKFLKIYTPFYKFANTSHEIIPNLNIVIFIFIVIGNSRKEKYIMQLYDVFSMKI